MFIWSYDTLYMLKMENFEDKPPPPPKKKELEIEDNSPKEEDYTAARPRKNPYAVTPEPLTLG